MTNSLTTTTTALAPPSPIAEWHAHLDLQVRAGQMAKDTATTYRQGMRRIEFAILPALDIVKKEISQ